MQVAQIDRKGYAALRDFNVAREQIGTAGNAVGQRRAGQILQNLRRGLLVNVDRRVADHIRREEQLLGLKVLLHGAEEVEVILREVGVRRRLEGHRHQLAQVQRMRGNLHAHDLHARVRHDAQDSEHLDRVRRGQLAGQLGAAGDAAGRADDAAADARRLEDALEQEGRRRLALGAGDTDELHALLRVAVEGAGHARHGGAHVRHQHLRAVDVKLALHHQRHTAVFNRLRREVMRVHLAAADAEEQALLALLAGIRRQRRDLRVPRQLHQLGHIHRQL